MRRLIAATVLTTCAGCFTLCETPYPEVEMSNAGENDVSVQVAGFDATVTSYLPVYGYETYYHYGRGRRWGYWGPSTVATQTFVPQTTATTAFRDRATEILETNGFAVKTAKPVYRVEVAFSGPFVTDADRGIQAAWTILSLISADYGVQKWTAKLKIYDIASGKLLMHHDYSERYQAVVWGPIPLFSPSGSDKTSFNTIQCWCLSALTDRAMADATAFLAGRAEKKPVAK